MQRRERLLFAPHELGRRLALMQRSPAFMVSLADGVAADVPRVRALRWYDALEARSQQLQRALERLRAGGGRK